MLFWRSSSRRHPADDSSLSQQELLSSAGQRGRRRRQRYADDSTLDNSTLYTSPFATFASDSSVSRDATASSFTASYRPASPLDTRDIEAQLRAHRTALNNRQKSHPATTSSLKKASSPTSNPILAKTTTPVNKKEEVLPNKNRSTREPVRIAPLQPTKTVMYRSRSDTTELISNKSVKSENNKMNDNLWKDVGARESNSNKGGFKENNNANTNANVSSKMRQHYNQHLVYYAGGAGGGNRTRNRTASYTTDDEEGEEEVVSMSSNSNSNSSYSSRHLQYRHRNTGRSSPTKLNNNNNNRITTDRHDPNQSTNDDSTSLSLDLDIVSRINASDRDLMVRSDSPGALRLTAEGLKQHEEIEVCSDDDDDDDDEEEENSGPIDVDNLQAWKEKRDKEKWKRKLKAQRDEELANDLTSVGVTSGSVMDGSSVGNLKGGSESTRSLNINNNGRSPTRRMVPSFLTSSFRRRNDEDDTDISLAPLADLERYNILARPEDDGEEKSTGGFGLFRNRMCVKAKAQAVLEKERIAAKEALRFHQRAQRLKKKNEERERQRIEEMRFAFLEQARAKESSAAVPSAYLTSGMLPEKEPEALQETDSCSADELSESASSRESPSSPSTQRRKSAPETSRQVAGAPPSSLAIFRDLRLALSDPCLASIPELSTVSTVTSSLPACAVCRVGERTHIATPCMHYSFCSHCVAKMNGNNKRSPVSCPVCKEPNVKFSQVSF